MKVLITGVNGQLGYDVMLATKKRGHQVLGVDVSEMDITKEEEVRRVMKEYGMDVVVHCAAYTAVDAAEDNVSLATDINVKGTENIARICKELNCKMIYISTDYVFDGQGELPFQPEDEKKPLNEYGRTKYEGELAVTSCLSKYFIIRISWVFGINGKNFVKTMLQLGKKNGAIKVVNDQVGSPTYTEDLSELLLDMAESEHYGTYHATNEGECSWYEFAVEIFRFAGMKVEVTPVSSDEFPVKAKRPHNSRMSKEKLDLYGFSRLPLWQDALKRYIEKLKEIEAKEEGINIG